jgi:hypothetical protein
MQLNETFHRSRDELAEAIQELHSTVVSVQLVSRRGRPYTKPGPILSDVEREPGDLDDAEVKFEFSPCAVSLPKAPIGLPCRAEP